MTTPSKRSMEKAKKFIMDERIICDDESLIELAIAFDKLIEECATVADDCNCMELTNDSCKCFGIAKAIRLKLKG